MTVDSHVHITADDPARYPVAGHGDAINKVKSGSVTAAKNTLQAVTGRAIRAD